MMKRRWFVAGMLGVASAVLFFVSMATYAYPGESARLMAEWKGLGLSTTGHYPLMRFFAGLLGGGNLIAPVCGALAVTLLFALVATYVFWCVDRHEESDESLTPRSEHLSILAGLVTVVVFALTPAVRQAATHLEPRMFDFVWALAGVAAAVPFVRFRMPAWLFPSFLGAWLAFGICDSALFLLLLPFYAALVLYVASIRGKNRFFHFFLLALLFFAFLLLALRLFDIGFSDLLSQLRREIAEMRHREGWVLIVLFATVPFVLSLVAAPRSFTDRPTFARWVFHAAIAVSVIVVVATPLSPSALTEPFGVLPVAASAFAAMTAGCQMSCLWFLRRKAGGIVLGGVLAFVLTVSCVWNLFMFDGDAGSFADRIAHRIVDDLGDRKWFVTDGLLDDHLMLVAAERGRELHVVSLAHDMDRAYLTRLSQLVGEKGLGGAKNAELRLSLDLGVLPFLQDWLKADPAVVDELAIFGAPDIWYSAGVAPVPELLFFGGDPKRVPDWSEWKSLDGLLTAPKGWGSYRDRQERNPITRLRFALRRHLGFIANNRGVWLQDHKRDDEAWKMYELVLNEIDHDNICAIFNEVGMIGAKHPSAVAKRRDLERMLKQAVDDTSRRYLLWRLGSYYGYIRNPDIFIKLGHAWARSGRPGEALSQVRRAIDLVPTDRRHSLMNMMASLYANENEQGKSRAIYESVLAKNDGDHDALVGLMRLELLDGNSERALTYLQKAAAASGSGRTAKVEFAMVAMMKNDLTEAKRLLEEVANADSKDLQAWSLLAAVTMQQIDAEKDAKKRAVLEKGLENEILPRMESQSRADSDYYLQTTRGFILMRKGAERRREARAAFVKAAQARPDSPVAQDLVLGMDISLADREGAEAHARDVLRRNRNAPLANYVMGSVALGRGDYPAAETYLRRAADAPRPVVLALNDLAEVLRRTGKSSEAERYARLAVKNAPNLYVAWETLGSILMDANGDLGEAESAIRKACELSKGTGANVHDPDVRMLVSLLRVQLRNDDKLHARMTRAKIESRLGELSDFERKEYERVKNGEVKK